MASSWFPSFFQNNNNQNNGALEHEQHKHNDSENDSGRVATSSSIDFAATLASTTANKNHHENNSNNNQHQHHPQSHPHSTKVSSSLQLSIPTHEQSANSNTTTATHSRSLDSTPLASPNNNAQIYNNNQYNGLLPPRIPAIQLMMSRAGQYQQQMSNTHAAAIAPATAPVTPLVSATASSSSSSSASHPFDSTLSPIPSRADLLITPADVAIVRERLMRKAAKLAASNANNANGNGFTQMTTTAARDAQTIAAASATQPIISSSIPLPSPALPYSSVWNDLLHRQENIDHIRTDPQVHALIESGVPTAARAQLWKLLSGANEERRRYPANYYHTLLSIHTEHNTPFQDEIRRDLARTLPRINMFNARKQPIEQPDKGGLAKLNRVLCAYAIRNPSLGYCQGMNALAGTLLTVMEEEEDAFWCLAVLVESRMGYYCRSMCGLEVDQLVFSSLVQYFLPSLYDHLKQYDVTIPSFTVSWFVCLFVEAPLDSMNDIYAVWDRLLLYGDEMLFAMSIALLRSKLHAILKIKETGDLLEYMLHSGFKRPPINTEEYENMEGQQQKTEQTSNGNQQQHPSPLNVSSLLHDEIPKLGNLSREISALRAYHRNLVLTKSKTLHHHTAHRLALQFKYKSAEEVQMHWKNFLAPDPWSILLHGSLTSPIKFYEAFVVNVWPEAIRRRWRDLGLFSGFIDRLFLIIDTDKRHEITFEQYLAGCYLFLHADDEEKYRFAFRWFDIDGDGNIGRIEMKICFIQLHKMYDGAEMQDINNNAANTNTGDNYTNNNNVNSTPSDDAAAATVPIPHGRSVSSASASTSPRGDSRDEVASMFVDMLFQRAAELSYASACATATQRGTSPPVFSEMLTRLGQVGLNYTQFRRTITMHHLTQLTFSLKPTIKPGSSKDNKSMSSSTPAKTGKSVHSAAATPRTINNNGPGAALAKAFISTQTTTTIVNTTTSNARVSTAGIAAHNQQMSRDDSMPSSTNSVTVNNTSSKSATMITSVASDNQGNSRRRSLSSITPLLSTPISFTSMMRSSTTRVNQLQQPVLVASSIAATTASNPMQTNSGKPIYEEYNY